MKVLIFHPVLLPPKNYGGAERVAIWLARGLQELGHQVTIAALDTSQLPSGIRLYPVSPHQKSAEILLHDKELNYDIVHFFAPPELGVQEALKVRGVASVVTIHGNGKVGEIFPKNSIFVSKNHAERHGAQAFVYNGVDPSEFIFNDRKKSHLLFFSKTNLKTKNLSGAIKLAERSNIPLQIAGGNRPFLLRLKVFWNHLLKHQMKWIGPVEGKTKAIILSEAKALIFPVLWDEPFGLVVIEALISGTPVVASKRGSLPELIPSSVGQLISLSHLDDELQWVQALKDLSSNKMTWDPQECRKWALEHFHYHIMAQAYVQMYIKVCRGEFLNLKVPQSNIQGRNESL